MNQDSRLLDKIYSVTRGDLDSTVFPMPDPERMLDESSVVRLTRAARFWRHPDFGVDALMESTCHLLASFHAQSSPFLFILRGEARNAECWIGGPQALFTKEAVSRTVRSALPDCRTDDVSCFPDDHFASLGHAAFVTGTPSLPEHDGQRSPGEQIESIIRGLQGRRWAFLVSARPQPAALVVRAINEVGSEIRDSKATYLLKQSPIDEFNRAAQRYLELLEAKLRRLESGRVQGMWLVHAAMFAEDSATLELGKGLLHGAFSGERSIPDPIRCCPCDRGTTEVPTLEPIPTADLAAFVRPPHEEYPGYEVVEYVRYGVHDPSYSASPARVVIGETIDRGVLTGNSVGVSRDDFTKHGLIVGITGSGKTNTCKELLKQVWEGGAGTPFLVIESAKAEYRQLLSQPEFPGLTVFTVGDENTSPLRLNPFAVHDGVLVQTHIDYVKSLFAAAFVLYTPMPYVLEQSLQEVYEDRGWDLALNVNLRGTSARAFPTLSDLARKIAVVIERMGYDERITMDVRAGLLARINQLRVGGGKSRLFDGSYTTSDALLFDNPCIIELKNLVNDDEKAFLIGLLLIRLYERAESDHTRRDGRLHHLLLIEEAHRLLRNTSMDQSTETANPRGRALEVFTNLLSEIRAFGEGILMAEQVPSKLAPDCIKNTSLKVVHRLLSEDDRSLMGKAMNLDDQQSRGLGLLALGEAVVFTEHLQKPMLVKVACTPWRNAPFDNQYLATQMAAIRLASVGGCHHCRRAGTACRPAHPSITEAMRRPFQRFVNALRFHSPSLQAQYSNLLQLHAANARPGSPPFACVIAHLADADCERRGQFCHWDFADVDAAVGALLHECDRLAARQEPGGAFRDLMKRLHTIDKAPFAGCVRCPSWCQHRFDALPNNTSVAHDFRTLFLNAPVSWNTLVGASWPAGETVPPEATRAHQETLLCFAVQQFHHLQISPAKQQRSAAQFALYLGLEVPNVREAAT